MLHSVTFATCHATAPWWIQCHGKLVAGQGQSLEEVGLETDSEASRCGQQGAAASGNSSTQKGDVLGCQENHMVQSPKAAINSLLPTTVSHLSQWPSPTSCGKKKAGGEGIWNQCTALEKNAQSGFFFCICQTLDGLDFFFPEVKVCIAYTFTWLHVFSMFTYETPALCFYRKLKLLWHETGSEIPTCLNMPVLDFYIPRTSKAQPNPKLILAMA